MKTPWQMFAKNFFPRPQSTLPFFFELHSFVACSFSLISLYSKTQKKEEKSFKARRQQRSLVLIFPLSGLPPPNTHLLFLFIIKSFIFLQQRGDPSYLAESDRKPNGPIHSILMDIRFEIRRGIYPPKVIGSGDK